MRRAIGSIPKIFRELQTLTAEHAALNTAEAAREQELDLLRHQITEISAANLGAEEEEKSKRRYKLASNSKRLIELAGADCQQTFGNRRFDSLAISETQRLLRELEKIDIRFPNLSPATKLQSSN